MTKLYQIRCPIHGLIAMNDWERKLIDTDVFQRLRRIRQLAWTDYVYPGAMHTRFEHSIGVMHVAGLLFDAIVQNSKDVLLELYGGSEDWIKRERQKVRLAALLHDVGHSPFSHASEELFPVKRPGGVSKTGFLFADQLPQIRYKHEEYSIALIKGPLRFHIESHDLNNAFGITADHIADLLQGGTAAGPTLVWREILSNQLDADRMDYLLRDSHHLGVRYGNYDFHRLVSSVCAFRYISEEDPQPRVKIGVLKGGLHAAESLIVARYSMFKQVYFHKTRTAYDIHLQHAMAELLPGGVFPMPDDDGLVDYLSWSDWKVQGLLAEGKGGEHAKRLLQRQHYRLVYTSRDRFSSSTQKQAFKLLLQEEKKLEVIKAALGPLLKVERTSKNTWYKASSADITVVDESNRSNLNPLSDFTSIAELNAQEQNLLYVCREDIDAAQTLIDKAISRQVEPLSPKKKRKSVKRTTKRRKAKDVTAVLPSIGRKSSTSVTTFPAKGKKEASDAS